MSGGGGETRLNIGKGAIGELSCQAAAAAAWLPVGEREGCDAARQSEQDEHGKDRVEQGKGSRAKGGRSCNLLMLILPRFRLYCVATPISLHVIDPT